ncbi:unnamed protein product [Alopecurus aequalis]
MTAQVIAFLLMLLPVAALSSSMVFQLQGNVYPIGGFTWLECDVPHEVYRPRLNNKLLCEDERCVAMHGDLGIEHDCTKYPNQCNYKIIYAGDESSLGLLLADKFSLPTTNDRLNFAFGCGYYQVGGLDERPVDGVLGVGKGTGNFVSQLKQQGMIDENVVGHCLSFHGGGFLFFGRDSDRIPSADVTWLPMVKDYRIYYSPGRSTLNLDVQQEYYISVTQMDAVFDSGSTYTYVHMETYARLLWAVVDITLQDSSLAKVTDPEHPQCWGYNEPIQSINDVKNEFQPLQWSFTHGGNQATVEIPPENYIVVTERGNVCLGIFNGSAHDVHDFNIIGGIMMQNHVVIYDNERAQIGWVRAWCDELPGHQPLIGSHL